MTVQLRFPPRLVGARQPGGIDQTHRTLAPWALATVVLTGQAMASLDAAIVNVAGPAMQHDLRLSGAALQLAIYSYLLMYAVALVTGARLGGRYGFGRLFGYGVAIFTVSSLACGLAVNPVMLVAARTAQGLGAALLVPQVLSCCRSPSTAPGGGAPCRCTGWSSPSGSRPVRCSAASWSAPTCSAPDGGRYSW